MPLLPGAAKRAASRDAASSADTAVTLAWLPRAGQLLGCTVDKWLQQGQPSRRDVCRDSMLVPYAARLIFTRQEAPALQSLEPPHAATALAVLLPT